MMRQHFAVAITIAILLVLDRPVFGQQTKLDRRPGHVGIAGENRSFPQPGKILQKVRNISALGSERLKSSRDAVSNQLESLKNHVSENFTAAYRPGKIVQKVRKISALGSERLQSSRDAVSNQLESLKNRVSENITSASRPGKILQKVRNISDLGSDRLQSSRDTVSDQFEDLKNRVAENFTKLSPSAPVVNNSECCSTCGTVCDPDASCFWAHRTSVFGELLLLTARGVDVPFATPVVGLGPLSAPIGPAAVADPEPDFGYRIGAAYALDSSSSLTATFSSYESGMIDRTFLPGGSGFLRAELTHPNTVNIAATSLFAETSYDIDFQTVDLTYRKLITGGCRHALNYSIGARYAHLDQNLLSTYQILGTTTVNTMLNFDGVGPRLGLDGEWLLGYGFRLYGRGAANILFGEQTADYRQENTFAGGPQSIVEFSEKNRVVPLMEWDAGVSWESPGGRLFVSSGYYISTWFDTVTTPAFINGVRTNDFSEVDKTLIFDGLTVRAELRF